MAVLQNILDDFNQKFNAWAAVTQCHAALAWRFDQASGRRHLSLLSVDLPLYRDRPPEGHALGAILAQAEAAQRAEPPPDELPG